MRSTLWLSLLFTLLLWLPHKVSHGQCSANYPAHLDTLLRYEGIEEIGNNSGPVVKRFLNSVGLPVGNPYCAAYISFGLNQASKQEGTVVIYPEVRSALASNFIVDKSIPAKWVLRGYPVESGWLVIWRKGNTIFGHMGAVIERKGKNEFETIEANTSDGVYGNQRDGQGVFRRQRSIHPGNHFRITDFTPVVYD